MDNNSSSNNNNNVIITNDTNTNNTVKNINNSNNNGNNDNDNVNIIINDRSNTITTTIINDNDNIITPKLRYQIFEGANLFLCNGRIMLGKQSHHLVLSILLIILTWTAYTIAIIPFLHSQYLLMISWTLGCINLSLLVAVATTDPGIVPRCSTLDVSTLPTSVQNNLKKRYTYCQICNVYRPIRSKHCRHCDNCVDTFDHHCPWTGNCIGLRNYFIFFCFVTSVLLSSLFVLLSSLMMMVGWIYGVPCNAPILRGIVTIAMMCWSSVCLILVGALWLFHIFLINRGTTTCEYLRKIPPPSLEPSTCIGRVWSKVCCSSPWCYQTEPSCCLVNSTLLLPQYLPTTELDDEVALSRLNKYIQSVY